MHKTSPIICAIDLQAAGLKDSSIIYSIGGHLGNVLTGETLGTFYERCSHTQRGRGACEETKNIWDDYVGKPAHREAFDPNIPRKSLEDALSALNRFIVQTLNDKCEAHDALSLVTQHGPEQAKMLEHAIKSSGINPVWEEKNQHSISSISFIYSLILNKELEDAEPLYDGYRKVAKHEAKHLFKMAHTAMRRLHEKCELSAIL
ncbi:MAG: hypothetical protein CBC55_00770 [Gammaproteobacteria bacterium TMED95]|nr:MAG: hypothetical protein CBC55_00770 [Gammaproteobacteria bacterium TMED95]|tara:strand:- start:1007 stop:1618 length:612 start_codon:yes stop_codon:yes gene_type:complete